MPGTGIGYKGKFSYQSSLQHVINIMKVTLLSVSIHYRPCMFTLTVFFYCTAFLITIQPKFSLQHCKFL